MSKNVSREKYEYLKKKAYKWKEYAEELNQISEEELKLRSQLKNTTEELRVLQNKYGRIAFEHESQLIRKDAEIYRLKASLEDYKERYKEIRDDNKELRKSSRN